MDGCFVVDPDGRKSGLALLWRDKVSMTIENYPLHHVDSLVKNERNV